MPPALTEGKPMPARTPGTSRHGAIHLLTIAQVCEELGVAGSTFYDWRAKGRAPHGLKLPNGEIRVRRDELDRWLATCEEQT